MGNEKRLIDANALIKQFDGFGWGSECDGEIVLEAVANAPTVDAVEVVHGSWIEDNLCCRRYCSVCEFVVHDDASFELYGDYLIKPNYCPSCGANMDGTEETLPTWDDPAKFAELVRNKDGRRE